MWFGCHSHSREDLTHNWLLCSCAAQLAEPVLSSQVSLLHWRFSDQQLPCKECCSCFRRRRSIQFQWQELEEHWVFWIGKQMTSTWKQPNGQHQMRDRRGNFSGWWLSSFCHRLASTPLHRTSYCRLYHSSSVGSYCTHKHFSGRNFGSCPLYCEPPRERLLRSPRKWWTGLHSWQCFQPLARCRRASCRIA